MALPFAYQDFSGGLNTLNSPDLLTDNEARDLSNVQGTLAGAITKRNGMVTFASLADAPTSLFAFEQSGFMELIAAVGTGLFSVSTGGAVASIAAGLTSGLRWEFVGAPLVAGQGPAYGINGTNQPVQWAGSGVAGVWTNASGGVGVPNGKYCAFYRNQVYVAGTAAVPAGMAAAPDPKSRLYWSSIADPTNWDPASLKGAGFMDFDPQDGQAISALGTVGPYLLVAKPRKLWVFVDPAGPTTRKLSDQVGCIAHRSMVAGAEGTYFLSEDRGVYVTNGSKVTPISDKIQPTFDAISVGTRSQAAGGYINGHYYLSVNLLGFTPNDTVLDFDAKLNSWWKHTIGSNQFVVWHPTNVAQLFAAKSLTATVDKCFASGVFLDNGVNYDWNWTGPWQSPSFYRRRRFPTTYFRKRMRQIRVQGIGHVDVSITKDFNDSIWLPLKSDVFAGASIFTTVAQARIGGGIGVADAFSLKFSGTPTGGSPQGPGQIVQYVLMLADRKDSVT